MGRRSAVEILSTDFIVPTALILSLQRLIGSKSTAVVYGTSAGHILAGGA